MKSILFRRMACILALLCCAIASYSQDRVTMLNGEKREGRVLSVQEDAIRFAYKGETLEYEFKKSEIGKIEFASGRTEVLNIAASSGNAADRKGKIAVLPYTFITNENALDPEAMAKQLQADTYNSVKAYTSSLTIQDPLTTNSLLAKQGLTHASLSTKTPQEIAALLGVEYVVYGMANVTNKGNTTYGAGTSTYSGKETEKRERGKETTKASGTVYSSTNATVLTNYDTKIDLSFFNDQGTVVYAESRKAFGSGADAYHATISYLVKRCPFGTKAKN